MTDVVVSTSAKVRLALQATWIAVMLGGVICYGEYAPWWATVAWCVCFIAVVSGHVADCRWLAYVVHWHRVYNERYW